MPAPNTRDRKVLVIAYGFPPIAHAGVYRTIRFCRYLPENGWKPVVITIREYPDIHKDPALLKRLPAEVRIYRTPILDPWRAIQRYRRREAQRIAASGGRTDPGPLVRAAGRIKSLTLSAIAKLFSIPDHMVLWIPFAVVRGIRLMKSEDFDVIYTSSPPHSEHIAGLILAKIFRKPWVADLRDPIVGNFNTSDLYRFELRIHGLLERVIVNAADAVVAVTGHHRRDLSERYPHLAPRFTVITNGFDPAQSENIVPERFDRFTIIFAGSIYGTISPDFFVEALKRWLETKDPSVRDHIQALFYGMGCDRAQSLAEGLGLGGVVRTSGLIPQEEIFRKLKGADLLLLILGDDEKSRGIISSKVFEYMALRRPIMAIVPEGETLELLRRYGRAHHVPHGDYGAFARAMNTAFDAYLHGSREAGPDFDTSAFDARRQVKDLIRVFNQARLHAPAASGRKRLRRVAGDQR
ncbi:MAG: glycosyltransferase [Desulfomonilia bacterium]|jgi:glycosyltransferase involved in cell wall biosynthesis